ncbi:MAG: cyanophycinase [Chloroflexi bacterium]|nr:cyanophycinase [Chloroflexota bacterium]MDA1270296.1 cyanophycinase [Chloroflexota bacterium]
MTTTGPRNGSLLVHGGSSSGQLDRETIARFVALAGGPGSDVVYIPTAEEETKLSQKNGDTGRFHGLNSTVLHTRDQGQANSDSFVEPIRKARAVFIEGGRQPRLAESYLNTKTHQELESLLERGGVVAGTSAGATMIGSFLIRNQGAPGYDPDVVLDPDHPSEGFGFLRNVAIDQHISARGREHDLVPVIESHPGLLGIGIDEYTAIHVRGGEFEVIGEGQVYIHDGVVPWYMLTRGARFDLRAMRAI